MAKTLTSKENTLLPSDPAKLDNPLQQLENPRVKHRSLSEKILCNLLRLHTGKWVYTREGNCYQIKVCRRCGNTRARIKHKREWRYIMEVPMNVPGNKSKTEGIICPLCGINFPGTFVLSWHMEQVHQRTLNKVKYTGRAICEQQRVCLRCGEIWTGYRIRHVWGASCDLGSGDQAHECIRCGEIEQWSANYTD